ncbi:MAG: cupredoxin domain-containing protein [Chloroflexota bacterium]
MNKSKLLTVVLILSVVLTACGGGGKPSTDLKVEFTDFVFTPNTWVVPAGQEITITAKNSGAVEHEFVIMKLGTTVGDDFGDEDEENIYWEVEAEAGDTVTATFTAPSEPGEYQIVCGTEGHFVAGMVGSLTVVAP